MKIDKGYALELAQALEECAQNDGSHVGPTDASAAAYALRKLAGRPRRAVSKNVALAGLVVAAIASPALAKLADLDGDGSLDRVDLHAFANLVATGKAKTFERVVDVYGSRFAVSFEYTPGDVTDQRVVNLRPLSRALPLPI